MKKVITGIGILVLLGILGGGWFFSGVTYEAGLNPEFENTSEVGVAEDRVIIENELDKQMRLILAEGPLAKKFKLLEEKYLTKKLILHSTKRRENILQMLGRNQMLTDHALFLQNKSIINSTK